MHYTIFRKIPHFKFCLFLFLVSRLIILLQLNWLNQIFQLHLLPFEWLMQFDAGFYNSISSSGYDAWWEGIGKPNYAFFPLLPLIVFSLHHILLIPTEIAGQLFSNMCFFGALYLFYQIMYFYFKDDFQAKFGVTLLAFSPFNIYFSSFYTESLFLFLSLLCFHSSLKNNWLITGIAGMLLSATRPTGVLILLPIFILIIQNFRNDKIIWQYWPIALIPFGLFAFMFYLKIHTGHALAFAHGEHFFARDGWCLHGFWHQFFHNLANRYNSLFLITSIYFTYILFRNKRYAEACYMFIMVVPAPLSGVFDSIARYSGSLFTFYLAIAYLSKDKLSLKLIALVISFMYLGIYLAGWITGRTMFI